MLGILLKRAEIKELQHKVINGLMLKTTIKMTLGRITNAEENRVRWQKAAKEIDTLYRLQGYRVQQTSVDISTYRDR
jgi:hypothetical protein